MPTKKKKRGRPREKRRYRRKANLQPKKASNEEISTIVAVETDTLETPNGSIETIVTKSVSVTSETRSYFHKFHLMILVVIVVLGLLLGLFFVNFLTGVS